MIYPISWEFAWPYLLSALVGGYLMGSIPFGLLLARLAGLGDIRAIGSGNIGATNVLRTGRKGLAGLTVALDAGKGAIAVLVALRFGPDTGIVTAVGAVLGHMFPAWLKFRGGKGVATGFGVLAALTWPVALCVAAAWLAVVLASRYSSLGALIASAGAVPLAYWLADPQRAEFVILLAILIWFRHVPNIRRLIRGEETKVGG
jgi:glycerol-3-phosphate acyltransferase PlsY